MTARFARLAAIASLVLASSGVLSGQKPHRVTLAEGMKGPIKVTHVSPAYPDEADPAAGTALLNIVIATDGTVSEAEVYQTVHPLLDEAAVKAVLKWKYLPTEMDGERVEVAMSVAVTFVAPA